MTRPHPPALLLATALLAVALAGCRDAGQDEAGAHSVAAPAAGGDVALSTGRASPPTSPDPAFDTAAFAGTFEGGDTSVQLRSDGRYRLRARVGSAGTDLASEGLWSLETGSGQLLLVPHAADEPRRRYSMPSADELVPEGGGLPLRRVGASAAS